MGGGASVSSEMLAYLEATRARAKYLVAATGSQTTAPIIIETGKAVVTIGGFSGGDNSPTVAQLEQMVEDGELKYVLVGGAAAARGSRRSRAVRRLDGYTTLRGAAAAPGTARDDRPTTNLIQGLRRRLLRPGRGQCSGPSPLDEL